MTESEMVLFANEAFYRAFADKDQAAMEAMWSEQAPCACIHPGWSPLFGREQVLESWAAIIANPQSPEIECRNPKAHIYGSTAFVICYEEIADQYLVATNVFVREGSVWKMVHHQAGLTTTEPEPEDLDAAEPVH